jgi:hypothetical protein
MAYVKVFKNYIKLQGQGHEGKNDGTNRKVLSQLHKHHNHTYKIWQ